MSKVFPPMYSTPEKIQIFTLIPCWLWIFVLIPMFMPFVELGVWGDTAWSVWLELGYHAVNGIVMLLIMSSYLKEDWFMITTDAGHYLKHIALAVGLIVGVELIYIFALSFCGFEFYHMLNSFPMAEFSVSHSPLLVIDLMPILGTIVLSIFSPFSICILFYCLGFAPICQKKPWLAYLSIAVLTLIPGVINIIWRGETEFVLSGYLAQLPVHLIACWSYQKTDNVWTPIVSLAITNLLTSIILQFFLLR